MVWKCNLKDGSVCKFQKYTQNWVLEIYGTSWTNSIQMWNLMARDMKYDLSVKLKKEWWKLTCCPNTYKGWQWRQIQPAISGRLCWSDVAWEWLSEKTCKKCRNRPEAPDRKLCGIGKSMADQQNWQKSNGNPPAAPTFIRDGNGGRFNQLSQEGSADQ